ncbi:MAG: carboxypeptidase regulatory-like domain-containing protein [Gemmatimonadales bacterium]|nr:carboxypeptidase regulatory-like domain-containing protein [Gemmatimonadales bacterium]
MTRCLGIAWTTGLGLTLLTHGVTAQDTTRVSVVLRYVPVAQALERLVELSGISLVFDPALARGQRVSCLASGVPAETLLRCIVREAGLDFYRLSSGTYVVIAEAAGAPRLAALAGAVIDAETGQPLAGARVHIGAGPSQETSELGTFAFARLPPGRYQIQIMAIGYRRGGVEIDLPPDGSLRKLVHLVRSPLALDPIIVNGNPSPIGLPARGNVVIADSAIREPGPATLVHAAANQLGVAQRSTLSDLHIQGGEAGEHQYRIDGVPVFDPVPMGRTFGGLNRLAVRQVTVRKAGFGVEFGSFTAGVIDLEQAVGDTRRATAALAADPFAVSARLAFPLAVGAHRLQTLVAVRRSLWGLVTPEPYRQTLQSWTGVDRILLGQFSPVAAGIPVTTPFTPTTIDNRIRFADLHTAARYQLAPFSALAASAYYASNEIGTDLTAVAPVDPGSTLTLASSDHFRWKTLAAQLRYEALFSARTSGFLRLRFSDHQLDHVQQVKAGATTPAGLLPPHEGNGIREAAIESSFSHALGTGTTAVAGMDVARTTSEMVMDNDVYRRMASRASVVRIAPWASLRAQLGPSTVLNAGTRVTVMPAGRATWWEPRIALSGDTPLAQGEVSWRLSGSVHRQFVNQFEVASVGPSALVPVVRFWLPVGPGVRPPLAYHLAAEALWQLPGGWDFRGELYAKWLPNLQALDNAALLDRDGTAPILAESKGTAAGGGIRVTRTQGPVRMEAGYDYSVSRRTFPSRFGGREQPTSWNEPHRVLLAVDVAPTRSLALSARARGIWGRTWALRQVYYDLLTLSGRGDELPIGSPGNDRLSTLYDADVGATWAVPIGGTTTEVGVTVLNALNVTNELDRWLVPQPPGSGTAFATPPRLLPRRQLLISVRTGR